MKQTESLTTENKTENRENTSEPTNSELNTQSPEDAAAYSTEVLLEMLESLGPLLDWVANANGIQFRQPMNPLQQPMHPPMNPRMPSLQLGPAMNPPPIPPGPTPIPPIPAPPTPASTAMNVKFKITLYN